MESFVDLSYRDLPLGRRIKLTQVRPSSGYLEMPTPMPVGTEIAITTDDGVTLSAYVLLIHEQVGGSDRTPGMMVRPALADDTARTWWSARVTLPDNQSTRPKPVTLRPRPKTVETAPAAPSSTPPAPPPAEEPRVSSGRAKTVLGVGPTTITADEPPATERTSRADSSGLLHTTDAVGSTTPTLTSGSVQTITADEPSARERATRVDSSGLLHSIEVDPSLVTAAPVARAAPLEPARSASGEIGGSPNDARTKMMPAVDQELLEQLARDPDELDKLTRTSGEHTVVDDGQRTTVMDAVDPSTLGLDKTGSGRFKTVYSDDEATDDEPNPDGTPKDVTTGVKKRRKKR